jgi:hypothetical protein
VNTAESNSTVLSGISLWLARAAWAAVALFSIGYFIYWSVYSIGQPLPVCDVDPDFCNPFYLSVRDLVVMGENAPPFGILARSFYVMNVITSLVFIVVSLVIVLRKSDDWMALLISAMLIGLGAVGISPETTELNLRGTLLYWGLQAVSFLGYIGPVSALCYFPDGRFVPRWSRWVCLALFVSSGILFFASEMFVLPDIFWVLFGLLVAGCALIGLGSMVYRYRAVATPLQRQQIKLVTFGLLFASCSVILWIFYSRFLPSSNPSPSRTIIVAFTFPLICLLNSLFPVSVAVAMIRYRLWDIDVIIRRTATYALLTGTLLIVFFGSIVILQQLLASVTGAGQNELVTVVSTLAIAALFVPLRNRIQAVINRRFNRKKYDAQLVLSRFAETVRDETDLEKLSARLIEVVDETMQPKSVSVWLRGEKGNGVSTGS